jgi:hypothetical protein
VVQFLEKVVTEGLVIMENLQLVMAQVAVVEAYKEADVMGQVD